MPIAEKLKQLDAARRARDGAPEGTPVIVTPEPAAETARAEAEVRAADPPRNADGTFKASELADETPPVAAAPAKPDTVVTPPPADATPQGEEIEIDGQKVVVDPAIAAAFRTAETMKADATKTSEREQLARDVADRVKADLQAAQPPAAPVEDPAVVAAKAALEKTPRPDKALLISDPDKWSDQQQAHEDARIALATAEATAKATASARAEVQRQTQTSRVETEARARESLVSEFYQNFPTLKAQEDVVNGILGEKFTEIMASGRLNKPLTQSEATALKKEAFADVAAKATRKVLKIMQAGKQLMPPQAPPTPPTTVASAPTKSPKPPKADEAAPRAEKYPKHSMSAALKARQMERSGART